MAQRISKKTLKQDEFLEAATDAGHWLEERWPVVAAGAVAVALVVFGVIGWRAWSARRQVQIEAQLGTAITAYEKALASVPGASSLDEVARQFEEAADRGGNAPAGLVARYYRGATLHNLGRHDEAIQVLQQILPETASLPTLQDSTRGMLARSLAAAGRSDEAIALFDATLADEASHFPREQVLLELGRLHAAAGHADQARASWQRVLDEFPTSPAANEARELLEP